MYSKTSMEQQTEQKLQCLYEMYKDKPIQSLFNTTRATREVLNGECVIGAIQYCGNHFNENISKNEIVRYFGDKVQRDKNGNITGIALNTSDWDAALNNWFTATYPYSQAYLIKEIANGKIACCRLGSDRSHAVVLLGVDADARIIDSVLMPGVVVEEGAVVQRALVADGVRIGKGAVVGAADSEHIELVAKRVKGAE